MYWGAVRIEAILLTVWLLAPAMAAEPTPLPSEPVVAAVSAEGEQALRGFKIPAGMMGELFAAEPLVANPVAFYVDRIGRVFVCESFRQDIGVTDNRKHDQAWVDDDLAAQSRSTGRIAELLAKFEASRLRDDPLANYREALYGGEARRGAKIFFERTDVSCARCHRIDESGGRVGPDLSSIALTQKREYLLEAVVVPNRAIAKGFESVMAATDDGKIHVGILRDETDDLLTIMTADGKLLTLEQDTIEARRPGQSPMPEDVIKKLSKRDLRDLVEFLSERKAPSKSDEKHE